MGDSLEITSRLSARKIDLLAYLAIHREGTHRQTITAELWPNSVRDPGSTKLLSTAITRLRATLAESTGGLDPILTENDGYYRLDPALVDVDYWAFTDAVQRARTTSSSGAARAIAYRDAITAYHGDLAARLDYEWVVHLREHAITDVVNAITDVAQSAEEVNTQEAIAVLDHGIALAPYETELYHYSARLHRRTGNFQAADRVERELAAKLSDDG